MLTWALVTMFALQDQGQEQDPEAMWGRRVQQVQERMNAIGWQVGRWEGTGSAQGQQAQIAIEGEWIMQNTMIRFRMTNRMGEQVEESEVNSTWSPENNRYEGYYFFPAMAATFTTEVSEDGRDMHWTSTSNGPMGNVRGHMVRTSDDEYTETIEMETAPDQWTEIMTETMHRVVPDPRE